LSFAGALLATGGALYHFHFWFNGCVLKLLPCLLLSALTLCLIRALLKAHQHSQKLLTAPSDNFPMVNHFFTYLKSRLDGYEKNLNLVHAMSFLFIF
jgi:Serpentine type 7TM GPCR chemoreceptor Srw